jgi:hypothetical protein
MQHCAHGHEQQALEDHVIEGVRYRAVDRQCGTDTHDHEPDLVDQG